MDDLANKVLYFVLLGVVAVFGLEWAVAGLSIKVFGGGAFGLLLYISISIGRIRGHNTNG